MYRTCLHCNARFPDNEALEALPIGRRVAFDARLGRLWVVCRRCERWNLTPFDARWEAIEQAERAFRGTRVRVSTDQIGLARLRDGTDLVRIGTPLRPEFAAWRYGDQFGRRRLRAALMTSGALAGVGLIAAGGIALGGGVLAALPIFQLLSVSGILASGHAFMGRPLPHPTRGTFVPFGTPRLVDSDRPEGWGIEVGYAEWYEVIDGHRYSLAPDDLLAPDTPEGRDARLRRHVLKTNGEIGRLVLHGAEALPLLRRTLPRVNSAGADRQRIADGVQLIEQAGGPEQFGRWAATQRRVWGARQAVGDTGDLQHIPAAARLAFEMALHEESERAALAGELATLAQAWQDAEAIAAVADALALPAAVETRLAALKARDARPVQNRPPTTPDT